MRRKLLALSLVLCLVLPLIPAVTQAEDVTTFEDVLVADDFSATYTTYTDFSGVTSSSAAVYAGNSAKALDDAIQLRSKSNSGIVTTVSGGKATKIVVSWNKKTGENKQLDIYGKNEAYTASSDLYNSTQQGTQIGSIICGSSTEIDITGDYEYIGLRSNSGDIYLDVIEITWEIESAPVTPSPTAEPTATPEPSPTAEPEVYTVLFEANGGTGEMPSVEINPEEKYELPTCAFTAPEGKDFWGWMATDDGSGRVYFPGETIYVEKNTVFDAQWVTGYVDELTRETTGVDKNSASYVEWAGKNGKKTAIYAGQSAGKDDSVQIKAENLSGIVTTTSGGKARKIAVVWNENTVTGRVLDIYGKNTPYTSAAELYGLNQGTKLGSIIYGTDTSIDISGEYKYIGLRSNSGAIQLDSIRINWEETAPTFITQSLVLSGEIGVNFYMDLSMLNPDELSQCYMTFTVGMGSKIKTPKAEFKEDLKSKDGEYYGFTCYVNAIQMADPIKATFHYPTGDGEKTVKRGDYSVRLYVVGANDLDETTVALARALINYGHFVQLYLSELRHWTIDTDYAEIKLIEGTEVSYSTEQVKEEVADYAIQREHSNQDIAAITFSLVLDSETAIRVYFRPSENYTGGLTATVDGKTTEIKSLSDGRFLLEIPNIAAHELGKHFAIVAKTVNGTANVNVSALSYVQSMLNKDDANPDAKNAVCAIYDYYKAAQAFIAAHQQ